MIQIENITKQFGEQIILNDISLTIREGQIFGLLGKNGAGKTTLMKMILGLLNIEKGSIRVFNEPVVFGQTATNRFIGYLPDVPAFYPYMTSMEYLLYCGQIAGLSKSLSKERATYYLQLVGLANDKKRIKGFSRGMKQRLGVAQALIHQPKILICDEPTSALDPIGRQELLAILQKIKHETTVIFSTHILHDAQMICDEIAILNDGKIVLHDSIQAILSKNQSNKLVVTLQFEKDLASFKQQFPEAENTGLSFHFTGQNYAEQQQAILQFCLANNILLRAFMLNEGTLEDVFMEVTSS